MAKKGHHKKAKSHRKHRKISGIGGALGSLMPIGEALAGAIVGKILYNQLSSKMEVNPNIAAAAPLAVGVALPMFIKSGWAKNVAAGMAVEGGLQLLATNGVLAGIGAVTPEYVVLAGADQNYQYQQGQDHTSFVGAADYVGSHSHPYGNNVGEAAYVGAQMEEYGY